MLKLTLELGQERNQFVQFNQYDRNKQVEITLANYTYVSGDVATIEWKINNIKHIQSVTLNSNKITFNIDREVTTEEGEGTFNVIISNTLDSRREGTIKNKYYVIANSIKEDDVSTELTETTIEQLQKEETKATTVLNNLNKAIESGKLDDYATKTELESYKRESESIYVKQTNITQIQKDIINLIYPVGIYLDFNKDTDPNTIYTWQTWERDTTGTTLVSSTNEETDVDFGTVDIVGGSKTQKANLSNTAFAQIAIAGGSKRIQVKQVATDNWNSTLSLIGSSANSTVQITSNGVNVAGTTNDFNNCMPYKTSCRWYRTK